MRVLRFLLIGGLVAPGLALWTGCPQGPPELPDVESGSPGPPGRQPFSALLTADRPVLIRGSEEAGNATLTVTTSDMATYVWTLQPPGLLSTGPLRVSEPSATGTLEITGVARDPGADGTEVTVSVTVTEWLCAACPDDPSLNCIGTTPVSDDAECNGQELPPETLTLVVRRPDAPLRVSLAPVGASIAFPFRSIGDSQPVTLRVAITGGDPFSESDPGECGAGCTGPENNGVGYCVCWSVEEAFAQPDQNLSSIACSTRLSGVRGCFRALDLPDPDEAGETTSVDATYQAPTATGNVVFTVSVRDAAGNQATGSVPVIIQSATPLEFAKAAADSSEVAPGRTVAIRAAATGGEQLYSIQFEVDPDVLGGRLVRPDDDDCPAGAMLASLPAARCTDLADGRECCIAYQAASDKVGGDLVTVTATDAVSATTSRNIPLTIASGRQLNVIAFGETSALQPGGSTSITAEVSGGTPPYTVCLDFQGTTNGTIAGTDCDPPEDFFNGFNHCTCNVGSLATGGLTTERVSRTYTAGTAGSVSIAVRVKDTVGAEAIAAVSLDISGGAGSACGNGIVESGAGEQCDGGIGCTGACVCGVGYEPRSPVSVNCQLICGNGTCNVGEDSCNCPGDCCASAPASEGSCGDGCDNDCDGCTDGEDSDCGGTDTTCDAVDDDCDGTDDEDYVVDDTCGVGVCRTNNTPSTCVGGTETPCQAGSPTETPETTCNDGIDNDCDGNADCDDAGDCPTTTTEAGACGNGFDDDCDGCVDAADSDCGGSEAACGDGVDNDCDGCTDGDDSDCGGTDTTCDAVDDDCDGSADDDYVSLPTSCGVGACASTGSTSCVAGAVQDSCTPGTAAPDDATCDGVDDDCDGAIDEDYVSIPTTCGVGACASTGSTSCVAGVVLDSCMPGTAALDDATCDGVDDDCDGADDEDYVSIPTTCGVGACASTGSTSCVAGVVQDSCTPGTPVPEQCDGVDNDCDGSTDEGNPGGGGPCNTGLPGVCADGTQECQSGALTCLADASPSPEICNDNLDNDCDGCLDGADSDCGGEDSVCDGLNDDCDGAIDEDYSSIPTTCGVGACASTGSTSCVAGAVQDSCTPGIPAPDDATCDGIDDDCDNAVDEDYVVDDTCGVGACRTNNTPSTCVGGTETPCQPGTPAPDDATCDGVDDDCDGAIDEDYVVDDTCGIGACRTNNTPSTCVGGTETLCQPGTPAPDDATCDGIDDDCDNAVDEDYVVDDTCGIGACRTNNTPSTCVGGTETLCQPGTPGESPEATCNDGIDNDCDGDADCDDADCSGVGGCP